MYKGCPVADGGEGCTHMCGGNWPGTKINSKQMDEGIRRKKIKPEKLGCGPLSETVMRAYALFTIEDKWLHTMDDWRE